MQVTIKAPYHQQVFVYGLRGQSLLKQMIQIPFHMSRRCHFNRNREPGQKVLQPVKVIFYGVSGVVSSLQIPFVVQY
jgi:hypothetical protein